MNTKKDISINLTKKQMDDAIKAATSAILLLQEKWGKKILDGKKNNCEIVKTIDK